MPIVPLHFPAMLGVEIKIKTKVKVKSVGQECPTHTSKFKIKVKDNGPSALDSRGGCPHMNHMGKTILGWNNVPATRVAMAMRSRCP